MFFKIPTVFQPRLLHSAYRGYLRNLPLGRFHCASTLRYGSKNTLIITQEVVDHLERVSLVDFANKEGIERLKSAIEFADRIIDVNTNGIEPMISVLKDRSIYLRDDKIEDGNCRESVMANASLVEEEYFVAPPGNIPVTPSKPILEEHRDFM